MSKMMQVCLVGIPSAQKNRRSITETVDGLYVDQTSFGHASGQVLRRSQGTLLPLSVNPRYRIRGTMCNTRSNLISGKHFDLEKGFCI
jgi:hypothetical protein